MRKEEWRMVPGYEGLYMVSNLGRIFGIKRGKIRTLTIDHKGYYRVLLCKNGKQKSIRVHQLVAMAFIPNPENKAEVHHIDRDRTNNSVDNLMWVTPEEHKLIHSEDIKHIFQYSLSGVFVCEYASMEELLKTNPTFDRVSILNCCNGIYKTANGYQWRYEKYEHIPSVKPRKERISDGNSKGIEMCDMTGETESCFKSATEASKILGVSRSSISNNLIGLSGYVRVDGVKHMFRYKQPEAV
ncbi:MAG: HNH endonuclease [Prevotella sp.]|nr:HNH endonuclease [Prevotella sp.]